MCAFRIADRRFPIFDGAGGRLIGGRWSAPGKPVIYAAETYAGAMLEVLVHANLGRIPKTHAVVEITIPERISIETLTANELPRRDAEDQFVSRAFGDRWLAECRTAVLIVPSTATRGREHNVLLNPEHPDFGKITASKPQNIVWDERLFQRA